MSIHRLDAVAHGECHGARTTAAVLESFMHLVQKKDRPYFKAILDYIRMNTLRWVQDEGYSSDFMFRNHKRKGHTLVSAEAYISSTPASGVPTNREAVSARDAKQTEPSAPCGSACNFTTSAQIGGNSPLADAPVDKSSNTARGGAPEPRNPSNAAAMREALVKIEKMAHCDLCNVYPRYRDKFNTIIGGIELEARAALKQPPRNCDRFDSYEQARSEWWKTEVMPRVYGVVSGAEKPFDEWLYAPTTKQKGETDGIK